jgi:hypothetical protein
MLVQSARKTDTGGGRMMALKKEHATAKNIPEQIG